MKRRDFIQTMGAAAAGGVFARAPFDRPKRMDRIGLETYSCRHGMAQEPDRTLAAIGAIARRAGIWLAFHNEPYHQKPIDGQVPFDVFIARLDPSVTRLQLDVGNMLVGGGDPMQYLQKYPDRFWSFHLKDAVADRSHDTGLGKGIFDFKRFLAAVPSLEQKPAYVEQEGATTPADELDAARANFQYLHGLDF